MDGERKQSLITEFGIESLDVDLANICIWGRIAIVDRKWKTTAQEGREWKKLPFSVNYLYVFT